MGRSGFVLRAFGISDHGNPTGHEKSAGLLSKVLYPPRTADTSTSQLRPPHPLVREDWQALSRGPIAAKNAFLEDTLYGHQIYSSISLL
jgi:hypothetical protein